MPIPLLNKNGFLPEGLHDATLEELRVQFGAFQESDRRTKLFAKLTELIQAMTASNLFEELLIDGSFVTGKSVPNDIRSSCRIEAGPRLRGQSFNVRIQSGFANTVAPTFRV